MEASILTQGLKRRGFIMGLAANCSDSEIAPFTNVDICFVFKIKKRVPGFWQECVFSGQMINVILDGPTLTVMSNFRKTMWGNYLSAPRV